MPKPKVKTGTNKKPLPRVRREGDGELLPKGFAGNGGLTKDTRGRKPGIPNKTTMLLKHAILAAAAYAGDILAARELAKAEEEGRETEFTQEGLLGFLTIAAVGDPKAYNASLVKAVLPTQVIAEITETQTRIYKTVAEVQDEMRKRGIMLEGVLVDPPKLLKHLPRMNEDEEDE